ncbi:MAG TPA: VOC family protein [Paludibacter sp.]|nr:VOC family protein [Paludibacter sp.]
MKNQITPCLWFDNQAEEAANFYTTIFKNSKIESISRYTKEGFDIHGMPEGTVLTVEFSLNGQEFTALNGGPLFKFNESISFQVFCETQEEIDYYWYKFVAEGEEGQCGWLKDKYGVSWQIVPAILPELLKNPEKAEKVTAVFMQMKKFEISELLNA